jgi:hypothetical protein
MARTRCAFTLEAVKRLLKAAAAAGVPVRIEIETSGKIVILPVAGEPAEGETKSGPAKIVL